MWIQMQKTDAGIFIFANRPISFYRRFLVGSTGIGIRATGISRVIGEQRRNLRACNLEMINLASFDLAARDFQKSR